MKHLVWVGRAETARLVGVDANALCTSCMTRYLAGVSSQTSSLSLNWHNEGLCAEFEGGMSTLVHASAVSKLSGGRRLRLDNLDVFFLRWERVQARADAEGTPFGLR